MADLLLLTPTAGGSAQVLPALGLLSHRVRVLPVEPSALTFTWRRPTTVACSTLLACCTARVA